MKHRIAALVAGIAAVTVITGAVIAQENGQGMQHGKMMQDKQEMSGSQAMMKDKPMMQNKQDMAGKKGMMKDMPMMQGGMMGGMMKPEVVATGDGGVIIVVGNLMFKYDKDLELVKKTTIEISDEDMQQMMKKMQKHAGMCRKMCQGNMADAEAADAAE